jgi:hypothetical protein
MGESMGSVPLYTRLSSNWVKLSWFVELSELIILVLNKYRLAYGLRLKLAEIRFREFSKNIQKIKNCIYCENIISLILTFKTTNYIYSDSPSSALSNIKHTKWRYSREKKSFLPLLWILLQKKINSQ